MFVQDVVKGADYLVLEQVRFTCVSSLLIFLVRLHVLTGYVVDKKLKSGIKVKDYVPSFGDRKNDLPTVAQCK